MGIQHGKGWPRAKAPESNMEESFAWRFPVRSEMEGLLKELAAFNERISELEKAGHASHAMDVLRAKALGLASHIDELRCFLVVPKRY